MFINCLCLYKASPSTMIFNDESKLLSLIFLFIISRKFFVNYFIENINLKLQSSLIYFSEKL